MSVPRNKGLIPLAERSAQERTDPSNIAGGESAPRPDIFREGDTVWIETHQAFLSIRNNLSHTIPDEPYITSSRNEFDKWILSHLTFRERDGRFVLYVKTRRIV